MNIKLIDPYIRYADVSHGELNINKTSIALDCRIFYVVNGEYKLYNNGKTYNISPDTIVYIPAYIPYRIVYSNTTTSQIKINFDFFSSGYLGEPSPLSMKDAAKFTCEKEQKYPVPFDDLIIINDASRFKSILSEIVIQMHTNQNESDYIMASLLKASLAYIKQKCISQTTKKNIIVDSIISYIKENYMNEISANDLKKLFNYHPIYLNKQFKAITSRSIHQYLIDYRCMIAKDMLLSTSKSIEFIAHSTGFNSTSHFSQIFKEKNGVSPLQFRKICSN